jgi:hypothetical protein
VYKSHIVTILNTLENISQLRNLWLRSPDERLAGWREFRLELQEAYDPRDVDSLPTALQAIESWWGHAPIVNVAMDPYTPTKWPTVWEILAQGHCCNYSKGLALAYNSYYLDSDLSVTVNRVVDTARTDERLVAIVDEKFVLGFPDQIPTAFCDVVDRMEVHETWTVPDIKSI